MENQLSIVLSRSKLLKNVNISKIDFSNINGKLFTVSEGEILYREGDNSEVIYLIISGEINMLKKRTLGKAKSYLFTDNDFFGNEEYFEETSRFSTAVALRDSYLIALSKTEIENLINQSGEILTNLKTPAEEVIDDNRLKAEGSIPKKSGSVNNSIKTVEKNKEDEFFQSVADSSRAEEVIVQSFDKEIIEEEKINKIEAKEFSEIPFLNEDGIPRAEGDLSDFKIIEEEQESKAVDIEENEKVELIREFVKEKSVMNHAPEDDLDSVLLKALEETESPEENIDIQILEADKKKHPDFLNEDGIPRPEFDFSESGTIKEPEPTLESDFPFEDRNFLDDDGIPKPEADLEQKKSQEKDFGFAEEKSELKNKTKETKFKVDNLIPVEDIFAQEEKEKSFSDFEIEKPLVTPKTEKTKEKSEFVKKEKIVEKEETKPETLYKPDKDKSLVKMSNFLENEIKKPILVSKRYAEYLKSKILPQELLQVVEMLLEQLSITSDSIQTVSNYVKGKISPRLLNVSLNNTLADFSARATAEVDSKNCQLVSEYDKDIVVKLDTKEFYLCYIHLVRNACESTIGGGYVNITTKRDDLEKKVKIFFRDNGTGIKEEIIEKIFDPFYSEGKKDGAGLGLAITKKIIEEHNGTIDVHSSPKEGTTFIITLPFASVF